MNKTLGIAVFSSKSIARGVRANRIKIYRAPYFGVMNFYIGYGKRMPTVDEYMCCASYISAVYECKRKKSFQCESNCDSFVLKDGFCVTFLCILYEF